ncbi:endonuclease/exonuclease/phosphatase family protein [Williamwhitmania taraxaci]|uniref:Metal-dependent hydrolase, endonuclease/exonuclease/phosphatase family n=1 Tax=Williamwhitmania taraxaci TaxID=1640674 RepID=A0A1G6KQX2_9BACT|nr:endonuclease/exonuclease/phosphatase family protein [Williamwhitmania taraxaci]SDC33450.1 Metal-dependent hydrolase, endonuclease/exonuclease/phosphatase family [Williamwhitmania taraxaci]
MRNFLKGLVVYSGTIIAIALVMSFLATLVSPATFWPLAYFGLAFPVLLLMNLVVFVLLIIHKKKTVIIPLIAFIICIEPASNFFQFRIQAPKNKFEHRDVKILTYNVHLFNLINWNDTPNKLEDVVRFINSQKPDIVCLQEFCLTSSPEVQKKIKKLYANYPYRHIEYSMTSKKYNFGIATLSKFPIIKKGVLPFDKTANVSIYSDIKIGKDTVRLYNSHLQSTRLREKNVNLLLNQKFQNSDKKMEELKDFNTRLFVAYEKRAIQVKIVAKHREKSKYPVIMAGDYNDPPISYSYRKMRGNLTDAFKEAGSGFGSTYVGMLRILRIDYIFHAPAIKATEYASPRVNYSDHYPVVVNLAFPKNLRGVELKTNTTK